MLPISVSRREHHLHRKRREIDELHGDERALKDRHVGFLRRPEEFAVRLEVSAEDEARDLVREQFGVTLLTRLNGKRFQESAFRRAHHLHAFAREVFREAGERQAGAVDGGLPDDPLEAVCARDKSELKSAGLLGVELLDGDDVALHEAERKTWNAKRKSGIQQRYAPRSENLRAGSQFDSMHDTLTSANLARFSSATESTNQVLANEFKWFPELSWWRTICRSSEWRNRFGKPTDSKQSFINSQEI